MTKIWLKLNGILVKSLWLKLNQNLLSKLTLFGVDIFAPNLIEYAFEGVSLSDTKFMGGEYSNESHNAV